MQAVLLGIQNNKIMMSSSTATDSWCELAPHVGQRPVQYVTSCGLALSVPKLLAMLPLLLLLLPANLPHLANIWQAYNASLQRVDNGRPAYNACDKNDSN